MKLCKCFDEIRENVTKKADEGTLKKVPRGGVFQHVAPTHISLIMSGHRLGTGLEIPFDLTFKMPNGKLKEVKTGVIADFCPMCGKSMNGGAQ